jgi:hypothetical protein
MKSYESLAIGLYGAILEDCALVFPNIRSSLERDYSRLKLTLKQRGLPFFTITLPALGKSFDKWLSTGSMSSAEIPQGVKARNNRPELFRDLLDMVFDEDGVLLPSPDINAILYLRQVFLAAKKMELPCNEEYINEALTAFYDIEEDQPKPLPGTWDSDVPVWEERQGHPIWGIPDVYHPDLFMVHDDRGNFPWDEFRQLCCRFTSQLGEFSWFGLKPKHGPGAVSDGSGKFVKYDFPSWPKKLERCFPWDWYGTHSLGYDVSMPPDIQHSSKLVCVPKTQKGPRLIAAEPTSHQWMQQGIWRWLEGNLGRTFLRPVIDFRSQEKSRERALLGSLTGEFATVDLSSASDLLSARLVQYVFQGSHDLLDAFHAVRTQSLRQDISPSHPAMIVLRKFSTQGSGLTFPVESIVFALIAVWAVMLSSGRRDYKDVKWASAQVTVFGDDIIVPTAAVGILRLLMKELGLKVNDSKTYSEGNFRESCGCDAFGGFDVTPAYVLQPYDESIPVSLASVIEVSNNFLLKGMWVTAEYLRLTVPEATRKRILVVPAKGYKPYDQDLLFLGMDTGQFGLVTFAPEGGFRREVWNSDLHKWEQIALGLSSKVTRVRGSTGASLLQWFTEDPSPLVMWEGGKSMRPKVRKSLRGV